MATITANTGSNNWNTNGAWVGAVQPTAADDVVIPASAVVTIPTTTTVLGRSLTVQASGTIAFAATTSVLNLGDATAGAGSVALSISGTATVTLTALGTINFISTSATVQTIATGTKTLPNWTINGAGSSYQLTSANTTTTLSTVTLTTGTLDTNGQTCDWGTFQSSNTNNRTLTLGGSGITTRAVGANSWNINTSTNMTLNAGSSTITPTGGNNNSWFGTSLTYNNVVMSLGNGAHAITSVTCTFANFTFSGGSSNGFVASGITGNFTVTGTLTTNPTGSNRISISSSVAGTPLIITAAASSLTNCDFQDITLTGGAAGTGTSLGDMGGNSGITTTTPVTRHWVAVAGATWDYATTANWSATNGGGSGASVPLCHDTVIFDSGSITTTGKTITMSVARPGKDIDFSAIANNPTVSFNVAQITITGNLTLGTMQPTTANSIILAGRGSQTMTNAGNTLPQSVQISAFGGTYTLQDALNTSSTFQLNNGTFVANGFNVTCTTFSSSNTNARSINMGSGTWSLTGTASGNVWNVTNTITSLTGSSSTIQITNTSANSRTFTGGGFTYGTLTYTVAGSTGALVISGANTFDTINFSDVTNARTLTLPINTITTVSTTLNVTGTSGKLMTLNSGTGGTLTKITLNGTSVVSFAALQDINANAAASIWDTNNGTNTSNNHNVIFAQPNRMATGGVG